MDVCIDLYLVVSYTPTHLTVFPSTQRFVSFWSKPIPVATDWSGSSVLSKWAFVANSTLRPSNSKHCSRWNVQTMFGSLDLRPDGRPVVDRVVVVVVVPYTRHERDEMVARRRGWMTGGSHVWCGGDDSDGVLFGLHGFACRHLFSDCVEDAVLSIDQCSGYCSRDYHNNCRGSKMMRMMVAGVGCFDANLTLAILWFAWPRSICWTIVIS